jgi:AraC-like DNA-binding protein
MFHYVYKNLDFSHKFDEKPVTSSEYEKHYHDFYEIYYFVKGNVVYTVEEEKQHMQNGDIMFIQPGEHHFVTFLDDKTPYERYVLKFPDNLMPSFLKDFFFKHSAFFSFDESNRLLFEKLDELYGMYNNLELNLLFPCVVTELIIRLSHSKNGQTRSFTDEVITMILQYINENIRKPLTISDLSEKFHFSQSYLYKKFYMHMKVPIMKYIRSKKIIAAYQLIRNGEKPTKVAEIFGFMEYSTFYRTFLSVMGFPPSQNKG